MKSFVNIARKRLEILKIYISFSFQNIASQNLNILLKIDEFWSYVKKFGQLNKPSTSKVFLKIFDVGKGSILHNACVGG